MNCRFFRLLFLCCLIPMLGTGCAHSGKNASLAGGDRDEHGCIASAGYSWSGLLKECIRPFEKGIRLSPVSSSGTAVYAAYLVFNADSSRVEVYLRERDGSLILDRGVASDGESEWVSGIPGFPAVRKSAGRWVILFDGEIRYRED